MFSIQRDCAWAWNGKGMCLSVLGDYQKAMECFRQAVNYDDSDVWFWHNYGEALCKTGRADEARAAFDRALDIMPEHEPSRTKRNQIDNNGGCP